MKWSRLVLMCVFVTIAACVWGCGSDSPTSQGSGVSIGGPASMPPPAALALDANGKPPPDYVRMPAGYFHNSCVHLLPNGADVDDNDNVSVNGEVIAHYNPCAYPVIWSHPEKGGPPPPTIGHQWVESNEQDTGNPGFNYLFTTFNVPANPTSDDSQTIYFFPAFNNSGQTSYPLLQPVLGWNASGCEGQYWCIASTALTSGTNVYQGQVYQVYPGDHITGSMSVTSTWYALGLGPWPHWTISTYDTTTNVGSTLGFNTTYNMLTASPAVLEVANVVQCSDYPSTNQVYFNSIYLGVPNGSWTSTQYVIYCPTDHFASGLNPSCNYAIYDSYSCNVDEGSVTLQY
jgi:hypothetical protein